MTINVWSNFSKKKNSTKQPTAGTGTQITVTLKENTSIENPVFILAKSIASADYTYVQALGHYYFVTDIVSVGANLTEIHCTQDVLATYKTEIGSISTLVMYDSATNTEIPDSRLSTKSTPTIIKNTKPFRSDSTSAGTYIVSLNGENKVGTFTIPGGNLPNLLPDIGNEFDGRIDTSSLENCLRDVIKQLVGTGNVGSNIRDVRWIPFSVSDTTLVYPLLVGMYDTGIGGNRIDVRLLSETVSINIPWQFSDWRNTEPYTQVYLYIPYIGLVSYPASALKGISALSVTSSLDRYTGDISVIVQAGSNVLGTYGASCGVNIPLGGSYFSTTSRVNSVIKGVASAVSLSPAGMVDAIQTAIEPISTSIGGIGNASASKLPLDLICITVCHDVSDTPGSVTASMGTPSFKVKTLSTVPGFIQCSKASIEINGRDSDRDEINSFLNNGFFYE